jgi:type I restriction enzyme S subunit
MANTDLTQRREILGQPALVDVDEDRALFSHHVYAVRLADDHDLDDLMWLYAALRDDAFRDRAVTFATGTTVAALPRDAVLTYELPWPERPVRHRWAEAALRLADIVAMTSRENRALTNLRDSLLPRLLSGELRVRDAESFAEQAV